jgi:hypothetical protein
MTKPKQNAQITPTFLGWWIVQNTKQINNQSGTHGALPSGKKLSNVAVSKLKAMNRGFAGRRM